MDEENDPLRYDVWIEDALRTVIRRTLSYVAANGLPGEHHFYITFRTSDDNVEIPQFLRAEHPEEMTIVLQYQYEDLTVEDDFFSVSLRFNGKPETLVIPFSSISSFADPSVDFGLQLKTLTSEQIQMLEDDPFPAEAEVPSVGSPQTDSAKVEIESDDADTPEESGKVIALDSFRKK